MSFDVIARRNDISALKSLLKEGKSVNERSGDLDNTPLHTSAWKGFTEITRLLLESGGDVTCQNKKGFTPAHVAANYGRQDVLHMLISHDESLLKRKDLSGNTILHIAAWKGQKGITEYLLKHDVNVHTRNCDGNTPYHIAVLWKRIHVLRTLVRHDKGCMEYENKIGFTLLHISASKSYDAITQHLLANGASIMKRDKNGRTPMQLASLNSQKVFNKFKEYKKIIVSCASGMASLLSSKRYEDNDTALHIMASFDNSQQYIHELLQSGSSLNPLNDFNKTPLYVAVDSGNASNVGALLIHSAKSTYVIDEETGKSPLHIAAQNNDIDCVQVLLKHGCEANAMDKSKETPLTYIIKHQSMEGVELIHNIGGDLTLKCRNDNTSLHLSVIANNLEITKYVLKNNPELINCHNCNRDTPLTLAVLGSSISITKILLEYGADPLWENSSGFSGYSMSLNCTNDCLTRLFENVAKNKRRNHDIE